MRDRKLHPENRPDRPAKPPLPLCRYEELAMRENRLREEKAAKRETDG